MPALYYSMRVNKFDIQQESSCNICFIKCFTFKKYERKIKKNILMKYQSYSHFKFSTQNIVVKQQKKNKYMFIKPFY